MKSAREFLVAEGLAKPGRGKFSNLAKDRLDAALAQGERFTDWPKKATNVVSDKGEASTVKPTGPASSEVVEIAPFLYPEDAFMAIEHRDGKKVERSLRSVCNTCGVSLVAHVCEEPRIVAHDGSGSVRVYIIPRKNL